jgi:hypothetical protein
VCGGQLLTRGVATSGQRYKFFAYNLPADGRMFIFIVSKKRTAFGQLILFGGFRQESFSKPAGRQPRNRYVQ